MERMPQHYVMDETVIGTVKIAGHEYTDRSLPTASAWEKYTVPEQTVPLVVKHWNDGHRFVAFTEAAVMTESYYVNQLFTSSSVNHKTGLHLDHPISHSESVGYGAWGADPASIRHSAEYFKSVMERWGWYEVTIF